MVGLEWFSSTLPEDEHRRTRRYNLDWKGPLDVMPDRQPLLDDLAWVKERIYQWFADWRQEAAEGADGAFRLKKALYFLRHTQHHLGELCATARILDIERPSWIYPKFAPDSVKKHV
jgi:hypothetical protein